jgi:hypothetical protein
MVGHYMCQSGAHESAQLLGGDGTLLVRFVAETGADAGQHLVEVLLGVVPVEADHEGVAEAALVRGVGGADRGVGGLGRARVHSGGRLVGEGLAEVGGGEVVAGLVGGGEERVEVGVGAVGDESLGPATAAAAGEKGGFGGVGGGGVEAIEAGSAAVPARGRSRQ